MAKDSPDNRTEKDLRYFEAEVLDQHHRKFAIWSRPVAEAIYAVVAAYDSMALVIREIESRKEAILNVGPYQFLKNVDEGFAQALRWITRGQAIDCIRPTKSETAIDEAGALLVHAAHYAQLAGFHVLYSRGAMKAHVDRERRIVRFEPYAPDRHRAETFAERFTVHERKHKPSEDAHLAVHRFLVQLPYELVSGRIVFRDPTRLLVEDMRQFVRLLMPKYSLPLDPRADLIGFSMADFRAFWFPLSCWSQALLRLFLLLVDSRVSQAECMPTQVMPLPQFIATMTAMSRLEQALVGRIVDRISYDPRTPKADPFLSPLLRAGDHVCWSPLSVVLSRMERNLIKAMARRDDLRNHAATLVGDTEAPMLRALGAELAKKGQYDYKLKKTISVKDRTAEIDLLAWTRRAPNEVLLIEGKALLTTDEAGEGIAAIAEIARAQDQITRAAQLLEETPVSRKRTLYPFVPWEQVDTYRLLVVTPDSQFGHAVDESSVAVATLDAFRLHVRRREYISPTVLCKVLRERAWLKRYREGPLGYDQVVIGDVTYDIPFSGEVQDDGTILPM